MLKFPEADGLGTEIRAIEYQLPSRIVKNEELSALHPSWNMERVALCTGVNERRWCTEDETALDLAEAACRKLARRADLSKVGALLFCTQNPDYVIPHNAALLQHRLGLPLSIAAIDYSLACSGFLYGLYLADALVRAGGSREVLLVTAETYSKLMNPGDRGPTTVFGDGAAVTLISHGAPSVGHFITGTDGGQAQCFMVAAGGARKPHSAATSQSSQDAFGNVRSLEQISMNGAGLLDYFKQVLPDCVQRLLCGAQITMNEVDLVVLHQASIVAMDLMFKALGVPAQKRYRNLSRVGNTISASIPIALRDAELEGVLRPGMVVLAVAFGAGLSWGGCLVRWR
jgi:3-oxoacyl-[acyl-carrier-protein] synthase-3